MAMNSLQKMYIEMVEKALDRYVSRQRCNDDHVLEAMRYAVLGGGKRVRALLVLNFNRVLGGAANDAMEFAAAIEMVHAYSLIHDDLPCMDDDDFRRGKPSCHKQFDEATALLAGDALLTMAFESLSQAELPPERVVKAVEIFSRLIGVVGMIGGQEMDLEAENPDTRPDLDTLRTLCARKTCALLQASCQLGVLAAGGTEEQLSAAGEYAYQLGMAFQIVDDILDVTADPEKLGKPVGSDAANGKVTHVTLLGLEGASQEADRYTARALELLERFPGSEPLKELTRNLLHRDY